MTTTKYYDEFLRYHAMAKKQQELCNLGTTPYSQSGVNDDLMENVFLYDVVERKYAGFSAIINDCFYGSSPEHPYFQKMQFIPPSHDRVRTIFLWDDARKKLSTQAWFYVFLVHRLTGSGINYAKNPSGYHNTILPALSQATTIPDMTDIIRGYKGGPFYTSVGYQFPSFPKPLGIQARALYKRGGDYFLCEYLPELVQKVYEYLEKAHWSGKKVTFRELGTLMFDWNKSKGLKAFKFQYSAFLADIADWFPEFMDRESPFYYGSNAVQCLSYLVQGGSKSETVFDKLMEKIYQDTGSVPYNAEDVCCDFIRYVENYIRPGADYGHLDMDKIWSSSKILDHPFGRQKAMLDLRLVQSFNNLSFHPTGDTILSNSGFSVDQYREAIKKGHF